MLKRESVSQGRKFAWVDRWAKRTGDRAKIDAKANDTYIVYETEKGLVKEYPDGTIVQLDKKPAGEN